MDLIRQVFDRLAGPAGGIEFGLVHLKQAQAKQVRGNDPDDHEQEDRQRDHDFRQGETLFTYWRTTKAGECQWELHWSGARQVSIELVIHSLPRNCQMQST